MRFVEWLVGPEAAGEGKTTHLLPRWLFLRALGLIYFSAFYPFLFQIKGLIGPEGISPAGQYLVRVKEYFPGIKAAWFAPTLFWFGSSDRALMIVCWVGIAASLAVIFNLWPRLSLFVCLVCFLSIIAAGQEFSSYQSDGMLLEAGFISMFFAPPGLRPGLGAKHLPSRASRFLLQWEWFRIYFESGVVKIASGDYSWRHLTAMDDYYQNGPLPTWIGWYVQHLPHKFHAFSALLTLVMELGIVFMLFLPRRLRLICFFIVTPFQIGIILTANYTFLNYLVLVLGFLLLDDGFLRPRLPLRWREPTKTEEVKTPPNEWQTWLFPLRRLGAGICLWWIFYATTALLLALLPHGGVLPEGPVLALEPFRIANQYGLFAVMTHERYEIEFQGSNDGVTWTPYPFRYKPQDPYRAPGIYAPYQPRFEWNLWFASLESGRQNPFVLRTEEHLLTGSSTVLKLFVRNPFPNGPPQKIRAVLWQYWFTDRETKRKTGAWWRRELLGLYALPVERAPDGEIRVLEE
ncbi:MAG TPA: lipase maturation factor family protein [Candidatus Angelobacter sp.]|nr:lipase maturation factor family protein [Candidatus Angelobacter sp.]